MGERLDDHWEYSFSGRGPLLKNLGEEIASVNESAAYEVDQTAIIKGKDGAFYLATASGCSCWDGDWAVVKFDTLDELFDSLKTEDYTYNPSLKGIESLKAQIGE